MSGVQGEGIPPPISEQKREALSSGKSICPNGSRFWPTFVIWTVREPELPGRALVVGRLNREHVDAVDELGRVDVRREPGIQRVRDVRKRGLDVRPGGSVDRVRGLPASDRSGHDAAVDEKVDVVDLDVVERPARHGEGAEGALEPRGPGRVDVAERRLVDRVVHDDMNGPDDELLLVDASVTRIEIVCGPSE